jgi:hypothetical protein
MNVHVLTLDDMKIIFGDQSLATMQRFGFDKRGRPLKIDGKIGSNTLGAVYVVPEHADQPLVSVALAEMVMGACEIPLGRNSGSWVAKYYGKPHDTKSNLGAWCAAFTGWCIRQVYGKNAPYSWAARRLLKRLKTWDWGFDVNPLEAQPGDVIAWSRNSAGRFNGHIGIVIGDDDQFVYVIEGNSGPHVRIFRYLKSKGLRRGSDACLGVIRIQPSI